MSILQFESVHCKDCCKCVGVCPVKAIQVKNHQAGVVEQDCILCGSCTVVCPQNTKHDQSFLPQARALIAAGKRVVASLAPSYAAFFGGCGLESMDAALRKLGFAAARETAEGAFLVKSEYERLMAAGEMPCILSSCCSTVNAYVRKYCTEALPFLAPVLTPMQAHARLLHAEDPDCAVVFIGPCVSKKAEAGEEGSEVALALSFHELRQWLEEEGVALTPGDPGAPRRSRFFPIPGGILRTMAPQTNYTWLAVDGPESCMETLRDIAAGGLRGCFIEMSFCAGGCTGGPAFRREEQSLARSGFLVTREAQGCAAPSSADFDLPVPGDLSTVFREEKIWREEPTEEEIREIFRKMGKNGPEDELNCGMCGYPSCREKAKAVFSGRAEITMCMPYMKKRAESLSDKILSITPNAVVAVDRQLNVQHINQAACQLFSVTPEQVLDRPVRELMPEEGYVDLLVQEKSQLQKYSFLSKQDVYLDEAYFYDAQGGLILCIMRNITQARRRRNQMIQHKAQVAGMADQIVEKQLRIVHEIASLLGESAAETKVAISELKDAVILEYEEE